MNTLNKYMILGTIFVSVLGSLAHFFYDWTNNNAFVGLLTPINESTWEHMKLIFFQCFSFLYI